MTTDRLLILCTANVCRSPMAQALLSAALKGRQANASVVSGGFMAWGAPADKKAVWAMDRLGFDISNHESSNVRDRLDPMPDLVLVMERTHLRKLAELDRATINVSFTLKEFVHLTTLEGPRRAGEPLSHYVARLCVSRNVFILSSPTNNLDIADPIGARKSAFLRCAFEIQGLVGQVVESLYPVAESAPAR